MEDILRGMVEYKADGSIVVLILVVMEDTLIDCSRKP